MAVEAVGFRVDRDDAGLGAFGDPFAEPGEIGDGFVGVRIEGEVVWWNRLAGRGRK